jgi:uncharacterized lipoprotein YmbA
MKKRTALGMVTAVALMAGCSSPTVSTQMGLHAQMEWGPPSTRAVADTGPARRTSS